MSDLILIENGLIPIYQSNKGTRLVNMRELHAWLNVGTRFNDWITRRIEQYGFEENEDYVLLKSEYGENTAFQAKEYIFKLDPAKEIAMVENNEKGKKIRKYFIQTEEKYKLMQQQMNLPKNFAEALRLAADAWEEKEKEKQSRLEAENKVKELTPAAEFGNAVGNCQDSILIRDYVKILANDGIKIKQCELFAWLLNKYIYKDKSTGDYLPYKEYVKQELFKVKETPFSTNTTGDKLSYTTKITGKGQKYFYEKLKESKYA